MVIKNICIRVLLAEVASAMEGLRTYLGIWVCYRTGTGRPGLS